MNSILNNAQNILYIISIRIILTSHLISAFVGLQNLSVSLSVLRSLWQQLHRIQVYAQLKTTCRYDKPKWIRLRERHGCLFHRVSLQSLAEYGAVAYGNVCVCADGYQISGATIISAFTQLPTVVTA